jgi:parvulin-like peptidyl-prolyl isomerase
MIVLALAGGMSGCGRSERSIAPNEAAPHTVAIVNNERIGYDEYQHAYGQFLAEWENLLTPEAGQKGAIRELVVQKLVQDKLLDQEAQRRGIRLSERDVQVRIQDLIAPMDLSDLRQSANSGPDTIQEWTQSYEQRLVRQKLIQQEVIDKLRVTQKDEREYYTKNLRQFYRPEQIRVRHLCVSSRDVYDRVVKALAGGEDFVQLIRRYSITPDRAADGDLGFIQRGMLPAALEAAIFENKRVGSMSMSSKKPVQTEMGFHIVRIEGYKPEGIMSFDEAEPSVRQILIHDREPEAYQRWLDQLRSNASITIDTSLLSAEAG